MARWGFAMGGASLFVFKHSSRPLWVVVHGDDFVILGDDDQIKWFKGQMDTVYTCKMVGKTGPEPGDQKAMRLLNRVVEWGRDAIYLEADQRQAATIVKQLGLEDARGGHTTGAKDKDCLLYTSPSPRDRTRSRMPSSA